MRLPTLQPTRESRCPDQGGAGAEIVRPFSALHSTVRQVVPLRAALAVHAYTASLLIASPNSR